MNHIILRENMIQIINFLPLSSINIIRFPRSSFY